MWAIIKTELVLTIYCVLDSCRFNFTRENFVSVSCPFGETRDSRHKDSSAAIILIGAYSDKYIEVSGIGKGHLTLLTL
jgi:hypothetical protein